MPPNPLTIVTWLWYSPMIVSEALRPRYTYEQVNAVQAMVRKHLHIPHRFVCVTDDPYGVDCQTIRLWDFPTVTAPPGNPYCWHRLWAFSEGARALFGERFVSIDLDVIILDDITDLFTGGEDFKILRGSASPYNGSLWMLRAGSRSCVWEDFHPDISPALALQQRMPNGKPFHGSDQAWISYRIPDEPTWGPEDGVYQYAVVPLNALLGKAAGRPVEGDLRYHLPSNARMIFFAGDIKPWSVGFADRHPVLHAIYQDYAPA